MILCVLLETLIDSTGLGSFISIWMEIYYGNPVAIWIHLPFVGFFTAFASIFYGIVLLCADIQVFAVLIDKLFLISLKMPAVSSQ